MICFVCLEVSTNCFLLVLELQSFYLPILPKSCGDRDISPGHSSHLSKKKSPSSSSHHHMASAMVNDNHVASSQGDTNSDMEDHESVNMTGTEDEELEEIKARVREMEEEAEKLKQMQDDILANATQSMFDQSPKDSLLRDSEYGEEINALHVHLHGPSQGPTTPLSHLALDDYNDGSLLADDSQSLTPEEKQEIDQRSIYCGNVSPGGRRGFCFRKLIFCFNPGSHRSTTRRPLMTSRNIFMAVDPSTELPFYVINIVVIQKGMCCGTIIEIKHSCTFSKFCAK